MSVLSGQRRNIDDITAAATLYQRYSVVTRVKHAKKIGLKRLPKFVARKFLDRLLILDSSKHISTMLNEKMINSEDLGLIHLTDSPKDAVDFIVKTAGLNQAKTSDAL